MGSDVAKTTESGMAIVKAVDLGLTALDPDSEIAEILEEALAGEELGLGDLERIKWPTGGATVFTREVLGNETYDKTITGVVAFQRMERAFWTDPEPKEGTEPDCRSSDARWGIGNPGDQLRQQQPPQGCKVCPKATFGSARSKGDVAKRGQACKLMRTMFMLTPGGTFPLIVSAPPGSLAAVRSFLVEMSGQKMRYFHFVVELSLEKATNKDGQPFARAVLKLIGRLDDESIAAVEAYRIRMMPSFEAVQTVATDAPADPTASAGTD